MWCMSCFQSPHHPSCPKAPAPVAFYCAKCTQPVHEYELEDDNHFVAPEGGIICSTCVDTMSVHDALVFLGCHKRSTAA